MNSTRREFIAGAVGAIGAVGVILAAPNSAQACLMGTWIVRCANGHNNEVGGITCNHQCEAGGCNLYSVTDGGAMVVCPNGHASGVGGATRSHRCPVDGLECRRDD
jgi:hypothetical protein